MRCFCKRIIQALRGLSLETRLELVRTRRTAVNGAAERVTDPPSLPPLCLPLEGRGLSDYSLVLPSGSPGPSLGSRTQKWERRGEQAGIRTPPSQPSYHPMTWGWVSLPLRPEGAGLDVTPTISLGPTILWNWFKGKNRLKKKKQGQVNLQKSKIKDAFGFGLFNTEPKIFIIRT